MPNLGHRMIRTWLAATCLAAFMCCVWVGTGTGGTRSEVAAQAQAGMAKVDGLLADDQPAAAVREARRLFDQLGDDPLYGWQIEGRLGLALLRGGDAAQALPHLETVMRHTPNDHLAHRNLAAALLALGKKGRALTEFSLVVELAPLDFDARLEYGQFLAEFHDVQGSVEQLEVARKLCPDCLEADRALAGVLLGSRKYSAAVEPLQKLMARDPTPWARKNLGLSLAGAGRDGDLLEFLDGLAPEGLSAAETNLSIEAEGRLLEFHRSLACLRAHSDPNALPGGLAEELLTDHGFWGRVSLNLLESGYFPEGLEAADLAINLDPENVVYRNNRVVLLLKLGREDEAAEEWDEVLRLDPSLEPKVTE